MGGTLRNVRILAGAALAITFASLWGAAASAHVTVQPATAEQGSRGRFVFRVPNESDTAGTIKLEVQTPKDMPEAMASLRVMPSARWDVLPETEQLATPIKGETSDITKYVSKITWTAKPGVRIGPGEFEEFDFTTGPLPKDKDSIAFKAIQTYDAPPKAGSDETEARWVEVRQAGQKDPARPEPLVKLTPPTSTAGATNAAAAAPTGGSDASAALVASAAEDAKSAASTAKNVGILALILGIIALIVAIVAFVSKPKAAPAAATTASSKDEPTAS
jgi:uncharacterized protein YcnI